MVGFGWIISQGLVGDPAACFCVLNFSTILFYSRLASQVRGAEGESFRSYVWACFFCLFYYVIFVSVSRFISVSFSCSSFFSSYFFLLFFCNNLADSRSSFLVLSAREGRGGAVDKAHVTTVSFVPLFRRKNCSQPISECFHNVSLRRRRRRFCPFSHCGVFFLPFAAFFGFGRILRISAHFSSFAAFCGFRRILLMSPQFALFVAVASEKRFFFHGCCCCLLLRRLLPLFRVVSFRFFFFSSGENQRKGTNPTIVILRFFFLNYLSACAFLLVFGRVEINKREREGEIKRDR